MFDTAFQLLLLGHIVGDYYLQPQTLAEEKRRSFPKAMLHCGIYTAAVFAALLPVMNLSAACAGVLTAGSHLLIDVLKWKLQKKTAVLSKPGACRWVYGVDQLLHLCWIAGAAFLLSKENGLTCAFWLAPFWEIAGMEGKAFLTWAVLLLLIGKPANITIKMVLRPYRPKAESGGIKKTGGLIGLLERFLILLLLAIEQYAAIGLVLTAKSIARYDRISKDQEFAEYYLLGTLLSTAMVMVFYFLLTG